MKTKRRRLRKLRVRRRARRLRRHSVSPFNRGYSKGYAKGHQEGKAQGLARAAELRSLSPPLPPVDALVISAGHTPSLEICVLQPLRELKRQGKLTFDVKLEGETSREQIAAAGTIIFVRNVEPSAYQLLQTAHEMGKRTIYVTDDNFLELNPNTELGSYYTHAERKQTFVDFLQYTQRIQVTAPDWGEQIRASYNPNIAYFPASVDFGWLDQQPEPIGVKTHMIIGYEGTAKEDDFYAVTPALLRILNEYKGDVRLQFFGYAPQALLQHPYASFDPCGMPYQAFISKLKRANWDIGIAPLADTAFNRGKTNNKFREYAACRIPGIYSNNPIYSQWITSGETGLLTSHTEADWYIHLKTLIQDAPLRERIKTQAEQVARTLFSLEACANNWAALIAGK